MPVVKPFKKGGVEGSMMALSLRGKLTRASGFGWATFGDAWFDDINLMGGTYQRRNTGYNNLGYSPKREKKTYYIVARDMTSSNPRTPAQQAQRNKMKLAVEAWQQVPEEERKIWNRRGAKRGVYGYHAFLKWKLKEL